ncbi:hypothetical protein SAMN05443661_10832 [Natronobacterium gregoryi]|uniref:Uncharacterized protein n=2 Tax=Natronobacterium gregoryi TaxID=44930 RepID=L0AD71_NATGS|nr:hypothetical protein Natgr_0538 [Natronobacterium gregoryi SP2]SFI87738.1 hypothetical protein SAMN05443661_10832 [Natronobacterium gregoryi]
MEPKIPLLIFCILLQDRSDGVRYLLEGDIVSLSEVSVPGRLEVTKRLAEVVCCVVGHLRDPQ